MSSAKSHYLFILLSFVKTLVNLSGPVELIYFRTFLMEHYLEKGIFGEGDFLGRCTWEEGVFKGRVVRERG